MRPSARLTRGVNEKVFGFYSLRGGTVVRENAVCALYTPKKWAALIGRFTTLNCGNGQIVSPSRKRTNQQRQYNQADHFNRPAKGSASDI
jgi:predicted transcriptional regulator